jgi:hypothetical protein
MPPTPPDVPLGLASWPGLDYGRTDVDTTELRHLARRLERYVESVLSTATGHLRSAGDAGATDYGAWDAAAQLHSTAATAQTALTDHHLRFLESVMAVVRKLNKAAHVYDSHERKIQDEISKIAGLLDRVPTETPPITQPPRHPAQGQQ